MVKFTLTFSQQRRFPSFGGFPLHCPSGEGAVVTAPGGGGQQLELPSGSESGSELNVDPKLGLLP